MFCLTLPAIVRERPFKPATVLHGRLQKNPRNGLISRLTAFSAAIASATAAAPAMVVQYGNLCISVGTPHSDLESETAFWPPVVLTTIWT
jgi:hypothetical protein